MALRVAAERLPVQVAGCGGVLAGPVRWVRPLSISPFPWGDREERYIQYSKVPTMHFQPSLPRLPIPKLSDTCGRYLAALRPVVSEDQLGETERLVEEFGREGGEGEALNRRLVLKDSENKHTSFIAEPWFDMYLASRQSLVLNYNPFMAFQQDPRAPDQADRAANFIHSAVRFRNALEDRRLEPDVYHLNPEKSDTQRFRNIIRFVPSTFSWYAAYMVNAFPLDMSQYPNLFNSTRVPRKGKDEIVAHGTEPHVLIMRQGHLYTIDAVQPNGLPVPAAELHSKLQWILEDPSPPPSHPLGYLTSLERDTWAELREELVANDNNRALLEKIDSALFVLCLDDLQPDHSRREEVSHTLLHNYGANRWFDKSFSIIVMKDGLSAINFEHAWGDGVAVLRFMNEIYKDTKEKPCVPSAPVSPSDSGVERLEFALSDRLKAAVESARREVEERTRSLTITLMQYHKFGKNFLKNKQLSPDAIMQLAFQIAYHRQYQCSVPTYESCSTAAFRHGRTETIRSASVPSKTCAETFDPAHPAGVEEMEQRVKESNAWHAKLTREAATGKGFDRHLFGLQTLAKSESLSMPIFQDPSYAHHNHIILSTSTLSSDAVLLGGFAPVTPDGYGVGYSAQNEELQCHLATYPSRDGPEFIRSLERVFDDLYDVLNGRNFKG